MKLVRLLLQIILVALVCYFGYFYFTRDELRSCVSIPLAALSGKTSTISLDQAKINEFLSTLGHGFENIASKSSTIFSKLEAVDASKEPSLSEQLVDQGQYLYCKSVVQRVEN